MFSTSYGLLIGVVESVIDGECDGQVVQFFQILDRDNFQDGSV